MKMNVSNYSLQAKGIFINNRLKVMQQLIWMKRTFNFVDLLLKIINYYLNPNNLILVIVKMNLLV